MSEIERAIEATEQAIAEFGAIELNQRQKAAVLSVLRAEFDREKNEPLTEEELPSIIGKPYFHVSLDGNGSEWKILRNADAARHPKLYHYGERWLAYRYEPKGEPNV